MRSKLMTSAVVVACMVLASSWAAAADAVQEQLELMEKRMAEMEDRLQATSDELRSAKATASDRQEKLSEAGLVEDDDRGARSGVGSFFEMVDVSGVVAASYNYRFIDNGDKDDRTDGAGNFVDNPVNGRLFRHPNADSFQFDQFWLVLDKAPTEDSRGGFHVELVYGETANSQGGSTDSGLLYTGYASYFAPIGNGIQVDMGRLATPLGGEVIQTNQNFNITTGAVFGLQPVTHVGISASTQITDGFGAIFGVVNDVYDDTNISTDRDKAYYGQLQFGGDMWALNVGAIVGEDQLACSTAATSSDDCNTSVFDVYASIDPAENYSTWLNFDWVTSFGDDVIGEGNAYGISWAQRLAVTDSTGISSRLEYLFFEDDYLGATDDGELVTVTGTIDHTLVEGIVVRGELRYDKYLEEDVQSFTSGDDEQLVALAEMYFEF